MDLTLPSEPISVKKISWPADEPISYPIEFRGKDFYVTMKPYRAFELKKILPNLNYRSEHHGDIIDLREPNAFDEEQKEFFWNHFSGFFGLIINDQKMDPDAILQFAKKRIIGIENAVIRGCLGMVKIEPIISDDDWFLQDTQVTVNVSQHIYVPSLKGTFKVPMAHHFSIPTQNHYRLYQKAGGTQVNRKKNEWTRSLNYDVVELLYNELIQSVEGMTVAGQELTVTMKKDWIELVPFWHKDLALADIFSTVEGKNLN